MADTGERLLPAGEPRPLLPAPGAGQHAGPSRRKLFLIGGGVLLLLLLLLLVGWVPRHHRENQARQQARQQAQSLPRVNAIQVRRSPAVSKLLLPGNITPVTEAYVYARATGYVRKRHVDYGDRVRAGQLLADIEAPDLDQQVAQAQAALAQADKQLAQARAALQNAEAQEVLARVTWDRYRVLVAHGAFSREQGDQQLATFRSAQATVELQHAAVETAQENMRAAHANLNRLVTLQGFEHVMAPFSGVITARNFDIGALVGGAGSVMGGSVVQQSSGGSGVGGGSSSSSSGSASGSSSGGGAAAGVGNGGGGELFRIAQIDVLRILVNVPQGNAPTIRVGQAASLFVMEFSKRNFTGKVTRTANALDPTSRTLLTEIQVPNPGQILLPGMYAQVQFSNTRSSPPLLVPGDSIITSADGMQLAVLEQPTEQQKQQLAQTEQMNTARRVHMLKVEVGRDYGTEIEITQGLEGSETLVLNPSDDVQEGTLVIPQAAAPAPGQGGQRSSPSEQQPSGIASPSREAPTQGPQGQSGGQKGASH